MTQRYHDENLIRQAQKHLASNQAAGRTGNNWLRILIAFGVETHDTLTPFTAAEANERVPRWGGWRPFAEALEEIEAQSNEDAAGGYSAPASAEVETTDASSDVLQVPEGRADAIHQWSSADSEASNAPPSESASSDEEPVVMVEVDEIVKTPPTSTNDNAIEVIVQGQPLSERAHEDINRSIAEGQFDMEMVEARVAFLDSIPKESYELLETAMVEEFFYFADIEEGKGFIKNFLPVEVPAPDINSIQCWVHENPYPDYEEVIFSDAVLKVVEDWLAHYDKDDNEVPFAHRDHYYSRANDAYPVDAGGTTVRLEWQYTTDSGESTILQQYPIGYNWMGGAFNDYYPVKPEPGELRVRYKDYQDIPWGKRKVTGPWSEPKRITHGFQTDDMPNLPNAKFTEPYIAIERLGGS